jgi:hypothetical protein
VAVYQAFRTSVLGVRGRWWSSFAGPLTAQTAHRRPRPVGGGPSTSLSRSRSGCSGGRPECTEEQVRALVPVGLPGRSLVRPARSSPRFLPALPLPSRVPSAHPSGERAGVGAAMTCGPAGGVIRLAVPGTVCSARLGRRCAGWHATSWSRKRPRRRLLVTGHGRAFVAAACRPSDLPPWAPSPGRRLGRAGPRRWRRRRTCPPVPDNGTFSLEDDDR